MPSACLLLLVMVVVCFLLWRNAKRQAQDRYYDPALDGSLNGFPVGSDYKGGGGSSMPMDTLQRDYDGADLASHQQVWPPNSNFFCFLFVKNH